MSLGHGMDLSTPKLFLVQPHPTPPKFLQAKLNEALCLANSLEEQRYGYFESDFFDKELPSYVVVQNLIARSSKPCVDTYFGCGIVENIQCHLNAEDSKEEVEAVFINAFFRNSTTKLGGTRPEVFLCYFTLQFKLIVVSLHLILQRVWGANTRPCKSYNRNI
ncbi:hypothetical protein Bca52824_036689 [Brassica carinata]|uniref:Uncharacterized protein n=1 Tax=Brassica carinata TaxID=52824 RepID=A0A8X7S5D0_BRACI|nr:hypothetical protein Bca52824_036689 [Brassica carinata]